MADSEISALYRALPAVDSVVPEGVPHAVGVAAARQVLDGLRSQIREGLTEIPDVAERVAARAEMLQRGRLRRVINATGVVLHTNLGRARWSPAARAAAVNAMGPCNLELDLESNTRGGRLEGVRALVQALTGATEVLVVNNCAAAVLLALTALARDGEVIVSRGELVEIGGSFRIPDVIASGGARLIEVGTTNRTRVADFVEATTPATAAWLRVHPSNFELRGFTEAPDPAQLRLAARTAGVALLEDLGSGCLGGVNERTVSEALESADLVMFSGDKLLGGPQCGLIVGDARVRMLRKHPLYRALRVDKVILAALEATLADHLCGREIPTLDQLGPVQPERAARLAMWVKGTVVETSGRAGGGTLPEQGFAGLGVLLEGWGESEARRLRTGMPAVLPRVRPDGVLLDLRCVTSNEDEELAAAVRALR